MLILDIQAFASESSTIVCLYLRSLTLHNADQKSLLVGIPKTKYQSSTNQEIKNTHVLQSALNIESKIIQGVPEKVSASEEYLYKPFSVGENGARAKVHTKLTLTGKTAGADDGELWVPNIVMPLKAVKAFLLA